MAIPLVDYVGMPTYSHKPFARRMIVAAAVLAALAPPAAQAQIAISRSPATGPDLGRMVRGSGATVFVVGANGAVTRTTGDGIRISSNSVSAPTFTLSCGFLNLQNLCAMRQIRVTVQPGASASARITRFTVSNPTGSVMYAGAAPAPASSLTFDLKPLGLFGSGTFTLGMDVFTAAGLASGTYNFDYTVTARFI